MNLVLKNAKHDTDRINTLIQLANACEVKDNPKYALPIIDFTDKLLPGVTDNLLREKLLKKRFIALDIMAFYYKKTGANNLQKIIELYREHIIICKKYKDRFGIADALSAMSDRYTGSGELIKRLECLKEGELIMKQINSKKGESRIIMQLAFFYAEFGDTVQAFSYVRKAQILEKEIGDSTRITRGYFIAAKFYEDVQQYDLAILNF